MSVSSMRAACALALGLVLLPAAAATAAEPPCGCWYRGYEDGLEFRWDNRHTAENFGACVKAGRANQYDAGFKSGSERAERYCPYLPKPRKQ